MSDLSSCAYPLQAARQALRSKKECSYDPCGLSVSPCTRASYHMIVSKTLRKRYELLDLDDLRGISEGKVNLLNKRLRQSLFQQAELIPDGRDGRPVSPICCSCASP